MERLGAAKARAMAPTPVQGVHQAMQHVFAAQNPRGQAAILRGVLAGNADMQTAAAVRDAVAKMGNRATSLDPYLPAKYSGLNIGHLIDQFLKSAGTGITQSAGLGAGIGVKGGKATSGTPGSRLTGVAAIQPMFAAGTGANTFKGAVNVLKNAGKDAWNLPSSTVEGLYSVGKDISQGHFGNAFSSLADPFVQLATHPGQTIAQHPLNSALMLMGPEAAVGRGLGGAARAGAFGDAAKAAASTAREPLSLGTIAGEPAPITDAARSYSPDLVTQAMQRARERYMRSRGRNPNIAQPAPRFVPQVMRQALNIGAEAKLNRISDEMTAVRQMAGRGERAQALSAVRKAAPPKEVSGVVSHILQGVIRTPDTAIADIRNEINRLKAAQTGKRTAQEIWNRKQVKDLSTALQNPDKLPKAFEAAAAIRQSIKTQDAYLVAHGLLDPGQAARRAVLPYAMTHMGANYDPVREAFTHPNGAPLSTQEILDHVKVNKVPDPAYVGHFPGKAGPGQFYSAYKLARGSLGNKDKVFTGNAFKSGAYDHTFEGLAGQVASRAEAVTKASLHDRVVSRMGIKMPPQMRAEMVRQVFADAKAGKRTLDSAKQEAALIRRGLFTKDEANQFARAARTDDNGNPIPNALELTPISTAPAHVLGQVKDLQHPQELNNISDLETRALSHAIEDAQHSTTRNVTLIPSVAAKRFADQFARSDSTLRGIGRVTQQFRRTVLPYSTHWMTQIGSEAGLRGLLAGTLDPRYLRDGRALMKRLQGTEEGRAALMEMVNATFYNSRDPLAIHNPNAGVLSSAAHAFPPSRALIAAHNRYANTVGEAMYSLEHNARVMGLGKLAHQQAAEFGHSWQNAVRLQSKTLDQLATRLQSDPALVAKFGRQIDDTFGKYNKFTPKVRAAIQSYAPFLPWYLNAAKYVLWNLPAHHPVASSLLASLRQTINQDVQDGKQAPLNVYAMQELARISPFGIFTPESTNPSLAEFAKGQQIVPGALLPEAQGSLYNYAGLNSFGEGPLKGPAGTVKARSSTALAAAMSNLLESFLPGVRYGRLVEEGGKPAFGTSTILSPQPKPGPGTSVVNRIFNPFYSFERAQASPTAPAYGAGPAPSTSGWGGSSSSSGSGGWGAPASSSSGGWG
jgi:hypothetical protein